MQMQAERDEAAAWFRTLRDRIVAELPPSASEEDFGVAMTGGGRDEEEAA